MLVLGLISCQPQSKPPDYFGQTYPGDTPIIFATDVVSVQGRFEHGISFTPNAREMAFGILDKDNFSGRIYISSKEKAGWGMPVVFKPLENKSVFLPYFSPDGQSMVYTQSKWDTAFHYKDLWLIDKNNSTWHKPQKMAVPISSEASVSNACMALDGTVFFSSNLNCLGKENCYTADLFYSSLVDDEYQGVTAIPEFISSIDEESVFISPNQDYILFCRYVTDRNGPDLYISYRDYKGDWTPPVSLGATINTADWERRPFVSFDNKYLFYTKLVFDAKGLAESDIYWVSTKKVFSPFVYHPVSDIIIKTGEISEIALPPDVFKDIDDPTLRLRINQNILDWIEFDEVAMKLTMAPKEAGVYKLIVTAMDGSSNKTESKVNITVID